VHPKNKVLDKKLPILPIENLPMTQKNCFLGKTIFEFTFYQGQMYIFEISTYKKIPHCNSTYFHELKIPKKMEAPTQYFEKGFFINRPQIFIALQNLMPHI
jgi:hypothetical protein